MRLFDRSQRSVTLTDSGARCWRRPGAYCSRRRSPRWRPATPRPRNDAAADRVPARLAAPDVSRAMQILVVSAPRVEIVARDRLGAAADRGLRAQRLDAAVVGLPAPTSGLRATLGRPRAPRGGAARDSSPRDEPGRLPRSGWRPSGSWCFRETNPAFHNAIVSICRAAGAVAHVHGGRPSRAWSMPCWRSPPEPAWRCCPSRRRRITRHQGFGSFTSRASRGIRERRDHAPGQRKTTDGGFLRALRRADRSVNEVETGPTLRLAA